jgi:hypothetical protein
LGDQDQGQLFLQKALIGLSSAQACASVRLNVAREKTMGVCPRYGAPGCGPACCLATAEQFATYAYNQPEFQAYCPLVARYGESLLRRGEVPSHGVERRGRSAGVAGQS